MNKLKLNAKAKLKALRKELGYFFFSSDSSSAYFDSGSIHAEGDDKEPEPEQVFG